MRPKSIQDEDRLVSGECGHAYAFIRVKGIFSFMTVLLSCRFPAVFLHTVLRATHSHQTVLPGTEHRRECTSARLRHILVNSINHSHPINHSTLTEQSRTGTQGGKEFSEEELIIFV